MREIKESVKLSYYFRSKNTDLSISQHPYSLILSVTTMNILRSNFKDSIQFY